MVKTLLEWANRRVRTSEKFPDGKIFVAKTFQIKRVNRVNFQKRQKYAQKVFLQILSISLVQIYSTGCIYKRNYLHLSILLIIEIEYLCTILFSPQLGQQKNKSQQITQAHFQIITFIRTLFTLSEHIFVIILTLFRSC